MKKALFLALITITTFNGFSQYHKLIDESKKWVISDYRGTAQEWPYTNTFYYFAYFSGDTILNNTKYSKLYTQKFHQSGIMATNAGPANLTNDTLQNPILSSYFFREDTAQKKVWRYSISSPTEELLMDFSALVGDTLSAGGFGFGNPIILDSISTVFLSNNNQREIRYYSNIDNRQLNYVIEGIGGAFGIENPYDFQGLGFDNYASFNCYFDDNTNYYGKCDYPSYVTSVIQDTKIADQAIVYPNPATNQLFFSAYVNYQVFDVHGKLLLQGKGKSVDVSSLQNNLYQITMTHRNGNVFKSNFLKR